MNIKKLLAGKGGAKIMVFLSIQLECFVFDLLRETTIRGLAAGSVADAVVSPLPYSPKDSSNLPATQTYKFSSRLLRDPFIQCLVDNVQSFGLSPAHGDHV